MAGALLVAVLAATACAPVKSGPPTGGVLMVGDSISFELTPALHVEVGARGRPFNSASIPGCSVIRGRPALDDPPFYTPFDWAPVCDNVWGAHEEHLYRFRPRAVVWLSIIETYPRWVDGLILDPYPQTPVTDDWLNQLTEDAYRHLTAYGGGLVIVTMPPATNPKDDLPTRMNLLNHRLRQFVASHPDVGLVDLADMACPGGPPCPEYVGNIYLREPDGIHFSDEGAAWAAAVIGPRVIL
jgi:hypothetical protein